MRRKTARKKKRSLKERIVSQRLKAEKEFRRKHPHAGEFLEKRGLKLENVRQHSSKLLAGGALASGLLLASPKMSAPPIKLPYDWVKVLADAGLVSPEDSPDFLAIRLKEVLPKVTCPLSPEVEKQISLLVEKLSGIRIRANLEGESLLTCYGLIGAEQHLPRFPGDTVAKHDEFQESGITPGKGAWGYFAQSKQELTYEDMMREKYYVAVQTLYLPDWEKRQPYLRDWYKYRKVMAINPQNGQAVVAVIADAGPAAWTGKQFGGSPEVMYSLGLHQGMRKGPVLLFFVDDPENKVPLGPVSFKEQLIIPKVAVAESPKESI
jgi:hypothetical protein